jgi:hypothetical protein
MNKKFHILIIFMLLSTFTLPLKSHAANSLDKIVSIKSVTSTSTHYKITYKLNRNINGTESLKFGYSWDPILRKNVYALDAKVKAGTYTISIEKPKSIGHITLKAWHSIAGRYGSEKTIKKYFNYPSGGPWTTTHVYTKADEVAAKITFKYAPGVMLLFVPGAKSADIIGKVSLGFAAASDLVLDVKWTEWLEPEAGQLIETTAWYTDDGYLHTKIRLWPNKKAYDIDKKKVAFMKEQINKHRIP